jgi:hypothetical protein
MTNLRKDLNARLFQVYGQYVEKFPGINVNKVMEHTFEVKEVRELSNSQLEDFIQLMQEQL